MALVLHYTLYTTGDGYSTNFDFRMAFLYYRVWVLLSETTARRIYRSYVKLKIDSPIVGLPTNEILF